jgi:hypothetical protein
MGTFGNLENLNLGMGLKAHESQFIPTKHAALDGWSPLSEQEKGQKASLGVLGTLLLFIIIYNLR